MVKEDCRYNIELFRRIKEYIRADAQRLDMTLPYKKSDVCDSVGCIAGTAVYLHVRKDITQFNWLTIREIAADILNLTIKEADKLFHVNSWPTLWQQELEWKSPGSPEYAEVVCAYIDAFIAMEV